ncbi:MAG: ATP-binding cassette domain-containing protein, partial [Ilumatobacteraceae bacterium]
AAGIERPTTGEVLADGIPIWPEGATRATHPKPGWIGMVFQDPGGSLDPAWTLQRILTEPFRAAGRPRTTRHDRRTRIDSMLSHVGLADIPLASRPAQLSGGQQPRVALARCLLGTPSIMLADEPTSALDVTNAAGVMHLLRATADTGVAVVLVSHDRRMLASIADRVLECRDGNVRPLDVLEVR